MCNQRTVSIQILLPLLALLLPPMLFSQARMVFNGANVVITNGAKLVIKNSNPDALTRTRPLGGVINREQNDNLVWMIGSNAATYTVPFTFGGVSRPLSFTTSGAVGNGMFILSTYGRADWKNGDYLPPGVTNIDRNGIDMSAFVVDRFWQISATGYTKKPSLSNLIFTYTDADWNESGNTINEKNLAAQRWNDVDNTWGDYSPSGTDDVAANAVTVPSVQPSDLYTWWTLIDNAFALPIQLLSFTATADNTYVLLNWQTATEINSSLFTVEKTKDMVHIASAGELPAAGNSTVTLHYSYTDKTPFAGTSYYRLKTTDKDGSVSYSPWRAVNITGGAQWQVYPNPVTDVFYIKGTASPANKVQMQLINTNGSIVRQQTLNNPNTSIPAVGLAAGSYIIRINDNGNISTLKIIKK